VYGDFEDVEAGVTFKGGDEVTAAAAAAIQAATVGAKLGGGGRAGERLLWKRGVKTVREGEDIPAAAAAAATAAAAIQTGGRHTCEATGT
jgi:hypothetical protein